MGDGTNFPAAETRKVSPVALGSPLTGEVRWALEEAIQIHNLASLVALGRP
jgi:hypothetical protein